MDNIQEITLDIRDNHTYQQLYTKQYDYGSSIIFHITKNGKPFEIEGARAVFSMKKPDNHVIENIIDVVEGKIAIDITEQMTSSYGKAKFSITLLKDDISITTITGIMKIDEAVIHPEDIESSDEYNIVVDILNKVIEAESAVNTVIKKVEEASDFADAAKTSATNAANSASTAIEKAHEADESASNAATSADDAANSAIIATDKANDANTSSGNAATSADDAANSANLASTKATEASNSANTATIKATEATNSATNAQNYAIGDTDSSKYYYEQVKTISESLSGALRPIGTITFANLPSLASALEGDMYNISDEFTTNENFKEGSGNVIPAGANIYKTTDGYWDILAGTPVTSVNGQRGNVNITSESIGVSFDKIYPVGSIYMSVNNVNPQSFFGGTWVAWGAGRVPVGVNTLETEFETVEKTGGAKTVNLQHSHTVDNHTHGMSHSHTVDSHTHGMSHSHTVDNHAHGMSHSHTVNSHKHIGTTGVDANYYYQGATYGSTIINASIENMTGLRFYPATEGRTTPIRLSYTSAEAPETNTGTRTITDGATPGTNTGTKTTTDGAKPGTNTGTKTATDGATPGTNNGLSTAQSILQPYITCYMWKRTA